MFYLLAAIACSACVSIAMRWSEGHVSNSMGLLVINYLTCSLCAFCFCHTFAIDSASFLCGGIMGVLLVAGLALLQYNIHRHGVIVSSLYTRLGVIVPILFSILFFQELPTWTQAIGIGFAIVSILYFSHQKQQTVTFGLSLLILLIANGSCDAMNKVFEVVGDPIYNSQFLLIAFVCAMVFAFVLLTIKKEKIQGKELFFGLLVGIPNYFSARFLLYALQEVEAVIAYPTYSVFTIIVITLFGWLIWKERLTRQTLCGMTGIILSIALMNL